MTEVITIKKHYHKDMAGLSTKKKISSFFKMGAMTSITDPIAAH
jgi:hypothetical protein